MPDRYIIAGGPGTGKTTLLESLRSKGYHCYDEVSREVIQQQQSINGIGMPWKNMTFFAREVYEKMKLRHLPNGDDGVVSFFDRGLPDLVAYLNYANVEVPEHYYNSISNCKYASIVFFAPAWKDIYHQDPERQQTFQEATLLGQEVHKVYQSLGFKIVELPKASVSERVEFVKSYLL